MAIVRPSLFTLLASTALIPAAALAQAAPVLPGGGTVAAGAATIGAANAGAMTITQTSGAAVIDWHDFSIGAGGRVDVVQPAADSALLNRVTGSATSTIAGQLSANGQVYLVNPNGIVITKTGSVNAAGFVASTLGISDDDFMAGKRGFAGSGASASVVNAGTISIVQGGYAALLGGKVDNSGTVIVPLGTVAIGAGERATLDFTGDGFLQVAVPSAADGTAIALSGRISADGGRVLISAATAREAAREAVNLSGVIEARGVAGKSGAIVFAGGEGGTVAISGSVDASGGGSVVATGQKVALTGATIDVSGAAGGGRVILGGDGPTGGALPTAESVTADAGSVIRAGAARGDGGSVLLWSKDLTSFAGTIAASASGTGGSAEISSAGLLDYTGAADLTGAHFGTLLLDPYNVTISTGANSNHDAGYTATANSSVVNATTLQNSLATANVTVSTGTGGTQTGTITVSAPVAWSSGSTLTLAAGNAISIGAAISAPSGTLALTSGAAISETAAGTIAVAKLTGSSTTGTTLAQSGNAIATLGNFTTGTAGLTLATGGNLAIAGTIGTVTGPLSLTSGGTITQTSGTITAGTLSGSSAGAVSLALTGNSITALGAFATGNGGLALADGKNLGLTGAINLGTGALALTSTGTISQSAGAITAGAVSGSSVGAASFAQSANTIASFGGFTTGNANLTLATGVNLALTGAINAGTGILSLAGAGTITQTGGTITAATVSGSAVGAASLGQSGNSIGALGVFTTGNGALTLATSKALAVTGAVNTGSGALTLASAGTITQTAGMITAGSVGGSAAGAVSLAKAGNAIAGVGALTTGNGALTLATTAPVTFTDVVNLGTGALALTAGGTVGQTGGAITAASLSGTSVGAMALGQAANSIGTLGAFTTGGGALTLATSGNLAVAGVVNAGTGAVTLTSGGTLTQSSGTITTGSLGGGSAGAASFTQSANAIAAIGAFSTGNGNFTLVDKVAALSLTDALNLGTGALALTNTGTITQSAGAITAAAMTATATGAASFGQSANAIGALGAFATANGNLTVASSRDLTLTGNLAVGTGTLSLTSAGALTQSSGQVTAAALTGGAGGNAQLTAMAVGRIGDFAAGGTLTLTNTAATTTLSGAIGATSLALTTSGAVAQSGGKITAGSVTLSSNGAASLGQTNAIGKLAGVAVTGAFTLGDDVAELVLAQGVGATTDMTLSNTGKVTQSAGSTLTARTLTLNAGGDATFGALGVPTLKAATVGGNLTLATTGDLALGGAVSVTGRLAFTVGGALTQTSGTLRAATLTGSANAIALGLAGNQIATLGTLTSAGDLTLADASSLTIAAAASASGELAVQSGGALTIGAAGSASGVDVTLAAGTTFTNNAGANAVALSGGQRLIYSAGPSGNTYGGLTPDYIQYSATYGTSTPAQGGNGFLYSLSPALSVAIGGPIEKTYDGYTDAPVTLANLTLNGAVGGDTVTLQDGFFANFDTADAGANKTVTVTGLSVTASNNGIPVYGYTFGTGRFSAAVGTVDPRALTLQPVEQERLYGDQTPATGDYTIVSGDVADTDTLDTVTLTTDATAHSDVGTYDLSASGANFSFGNAANYALTFVPLTDGLTVDARPITITADNQTRIYGDANPTLTYMIGDAGLAAGDTLTGSLATRAVTRTAVGSYDITLGTLQASLNYDVTYAGASLTITPRTVSVGLTGTLAKTYDGTTALRLGASNYTALQNTVAGDSIRFVVSANGVLEDRNVGTNKLLTVTDASLSGAAAGNYVLAPIGGMVATVNQAPLTITAATDTKVYDRTMTSTLAPIVRGLAAGDAVTGLSQSFDGINAGTRKLNVASGFTVADGNNGANYAVSVVATNGHITPATLTLSAVSDSKTYDRTRTSTLTPTVSGLIGTDTISPLAQAFDTIDAGARTLAVLGGYTVTDGNNGGNYSIVAQTASGSIAQRQLTLTLGGTIGKVYDGTTSATLGATNYSFANVVAGDKLGISYTAAYDDRNVGTGKTVSVSGIGLTGTAAADYVLNTNAMSVAMGAISAAALKITAVTDQKTYDATNVSSAAPTVTGLVGGDAITGLSEHFDSVNAGARKLVVDAGYAVADGNGGRNYTVTVVTAAGTILKRALTIAAATDTKTYDRALTSSATPTVSGLIGTDSVGNLTQAFDAVDAGARTLAVLSGYTVSDGNKGGNYSVVTQSASGSIAQRQVTLSLAGTVSKVYDGTTSATLATTNYSVANVIAGDKLGITYTAAFDDRNAGTGKTVKVSGIGLTGTTAGDYVLASNTVSAAIGKISAAALRITAATDQKTYDGTTVSSAAPIVAGLVGGDTVTGLAQHFDSDNAGARKLSIDAGYAVADGNNGANYVVTLGAPVAGTILKRALTIAAVTDTKVYDGTIASSALPTVTGLVASDSISPLSQIFDNKAVGSRTLSVVKGYTVADGNAGKNYTITATTAQGSITGQ